MKGALIAVLVILALIVVAVVVVVRLLKNADKKAVANKNSEKDRFGEYNPEDMFIYNSSESGRSKPPIVKEPHGSRKITSGPTTGSSHKTDFHRSNDSTNLVTGGVLGYGASYDTDLDGVPNSVDTSPYYNDEGHEGYDEVRQPEPQDLSKWDNPVSTESGEANSLSAQVEAEHQSSPEPVVTESYSPSTPSYDYGSSSTTSSYDYGSSSSSSSSYDSGSSSSSYDSGSSSSYDSGSSSW